MDNWQKLDTSVSLATLQGKKAVKVIKIMDPNLTSYEMDSQCSAQQNNTLAALRLLRTYNHFIMPPDVNSVVSPLLGSLGVLPAQSTPPTYLPPFCQHRPIQPLVPVQCDSESRRRGEKRPIPAELKDEKYFERRRRNNQAAKKSRDARRIREDQIAWRACLLEQENATLRAHVAALRQETLALRSLLSSRDEQRLPAPTSTTSD